VSLGPLGFEPLASAPLDSEPLASDLWTFRSLGLCAPKLPGSPAWAIWDRILVRSHQLYGQSRPKTVPRRPARRPETP
jgi:hypothetical protein